jgi:hypothetical protein
MVEKMVKINSNLFNFNYFLSSRKKVETLENGALLYGGATMFDDGIYSNIEKNEFIEVNEKNNNISIFVPSTIDINNNIDNEYFIEKSIEYLNNNYDITENLKFYKTNGSWFSDMLNNVIIENITIITLKLDILTENDINIFIKLAEILKNEMNQEGVSISINKSLAIV